MASEPPLRALSEWLQLMLAEISATRSQSSRIPITKPRCQLTKSATDSNTGAASACGRLRCKISSIRCFAVDRPSAIMDSTGNAPSGRLAQRSPT